jgi:hypothetical protein
MILKGSFLFIINEYYQIINFNKNIIKFNKKKYFINFSMNSYRIILSNLKLYNN